MSTFRSKAFIVWHVATVSASDTAKQLNAIMFTTGDLEFLAA